MINTAMALGWSPGGEARDYVYVQMSLSSILPFATRPVLFIFRADIFSPFLGGPPERAGGPEGFSMANIQTEAYERLSWEPGFIAFRFNCGAMKGPSFSQAITWGADKRHSGVTDLGALVYGLYFVWIEVKQPGEAHLDSQIDFAQTVLAAGGIVLKIITLDDLERVIENIRIELGGG